MNTRDFHKAALMGGFAVFSPRRHLVATMILVAPANRCARKQLILSSFCLLAEAGWRTHRPFTAKTGVHSPLLRDREIKGLGGDFA
jgi:hypothetical protein